ncbi:MAG: hypothetical protein ACRD0F_05965, partial [Acidimicrobiales bacterium]
VTGTPNHRLLVAGDRRLDWRRIDEIAEGDMVALQYGAELWSALPARFDGFRPGAAYGNQRAVRIPDEMSDELAWLLGAHVARGHTTRSNWTVAVTSAVEGVLDRAAQAWRDLFGVGARVVRTAGQAPSVVVSSKTVVEFLDHLGCGGRARDRRIPDAVLRSPRSMVLAFLQGLALDAYVSTASVPRWALSTDSAALLDDLQAVLTNLGVVHGRVAGRNAFNARTRGEVYATGAHAQRVVGLVPFMGPANVARSGGLARLGAEPARGSADVVPGTTPADLHALLPAEQRDRFAFLLDARAPAASRWALDQVAAVPGAVLAEWLRSVVDDGLHFSPVVGVGRPVEREVFDVSVPATRAFVGNGIVNHNTINMPEHVTVDEVEQLHIDAWRMGLKAVAVYRDNCKVGQPLSTFKQDAPASQAEAHDQELAVKVAQLEQALQSQTTVVVKQPIRERLPRRRRSVTFAFRVADCEGYVTVGEYDDGRPGEVFMKVSKQGSTLAGIMDAFSISVSLGLQHGVPLRTYVQKYTNMRFEPAGITDDAELRIASSLVDYIFRRLAVDYLSHDARAELGILTTGERTQPTLPGVDESLIVNQPVVEPL